MKKDNTIYSIIFFYFLKKHIFYYTIYSVIKIALNLYIVFLLEINLKIVNLKLLKKFANKLYVVYYKNNYTQYVVFIFK